MVEGLDIETQLYQKIIFFFVSLVVGCLFLRYGWKRGLFQKPEQTPSLPIRGGDVITSFALFFIFIAIIAPILLLIFIPDYQAFGKIGKAWTHVGALAFGFFGLLVAYFLLPKHIRMALRNDSRNPWYRQALYGMSMMIVSFPMIVAINLGVSILVWEIFGQYSQDQAAVEMIRNTFGHPLLFAVTSLATVTIVPLSEEFLFRGILQSWMKERWKSSFGAIIFSSLIFALFHYADSQGISNIELLIPLFFLSCVIGFTFDRAKSIWASVAFHSLFNLVAIVALYLES